VADAGHDGFYEVFVIDLEEIGAPFFRKGTLQLEKLSM